MPHAEERPFRVSAAARRFDHRRTIERSRVFMISRSRRTAMSTRIPGKTYGTVSAERQKAMTGLEFVQGLVDGILPLNTIAETLGYDITEATSGRVVVTCEPNDTHLNPAGTVHGGLAATLLDTCMGLAIRSTHEK